jgi:PhzF family phenazine biosynthesis protein
VSLEVGWLEYGDVPVGFGIDREEAGQALGLGFSAEDLHEDLPPMFAGLGCAQLICAVPNTMNLDGADPDFDRVRDLFGETQLTGLTVFTFPGRGGCFTDSRHFMLHGNQILEEAASPDAHAALAAYLCANQFFDDGLRTFTGAQGYRLGWRSKLEVHFQASGGSARDVRVKVVSA